MRRLVISGRVQGVGFRWALTEQARQLGLSGWVRNRRDGSVEATVAGPAGQVEQLLGWARRGPALAQVKSVEVFDASGHFDGFEPWPTA